MLFGSHKFCFCENIFGTGVCITVVRMKTLQHIAGRGNVHSFQKWEGKCPFHDVRTTTDVENGYRLPQLDL